MATYETVAYRREGRIGYITLNRPSSFNAVNDQLEVDLMAAVQEFDLDDDAWIAILHGAGQSSVPAPTSSSASIGAGKSACAR